MNILDVHPYTWGCLTGADDYLFYYRGYLNNSSLYGPNGKVKTSGAITITKGSSDLQTNPNKPLSVLPSEDHAYVHAGGQPAAAVWWDQTKHTYVNEWFASYGRERLLYYVFDNADNNLFANASNAATKFTTVLTDKGVNYQAGAGEGSYVVSDKPVYTYIHRDGPFGAVGEDAHNTFYTGGAWSAVDASTIGPGTGMPNAVPLIKGTNGSVYLFVDPENNLIYQGESEWFNTEKVTAANAAAGNWGTDWANQSKFLANFLAYVVNASQYGSHWTDLFVTAPESVERVAKESGGKTPATLYDEAF
jgi:hypothetical protein